jgi:hypothetical protein
MRTPLSRLPPLRVLRSELPAAVYNRIRLGVLRLGPPLRLPLDRGLGLDCVLDDAAWVCVDPEVDDFPLLAWTAFGVRARRGLHEPVACELRVYHRQGLPLVDSALSAVQSAVVEALSGRSTPDPTPRPLHPRPG